MKKNIKIFKYLFLKLCILVVSFFSISEYEKDNFIIKTYNISSKKIKNTKKIIFLSDIHEKEFGKDNNKLLLAIDKINPDFILIGGDTMISKRGVDLKKTKKILKNISERYIIYYANGNHELRLKEKKYTGKYEEFSAVLKELDIIHLEDSKVFIDDDLCIYGLDIDKKYYTKIKYPNLDVNTIEKKIGKLDKNKYNILLAHSPNFFKAYSAFGADLSLAGHFHGGTIRLGDNVGLMTPQFQFLNTNVTNLKEKGENKMIISSGLGTHSINIRINNKPELVYIKLESR